MKCEDDIRKALMVEKKYNPVWNINNGYPGNLLYDFCSILIITLRTNISVCLQEVNAMIVTNEMHGPL